MEILDTFGVEPVLLTAQIVNFLIILFLLKRFLYKPVLDLLQKREESIKDGIKQAEEGRLALEKAIVKEKDILKKAQGEGKTLIEEAKKQSADILKNAQNSAKKQTEEMIKSARLQIAKEAEIVETKVIQNISRLSIQILEKALSGLVNEKAQEEIISKAVKLLHSQSN